MITTTKTKSLNLYNIKSSHINKQILIQMAKNGEDKPKEKTKLGSAFATYTRKSYHTFDENFIKIIKNLRPGWLIKESTLVDKELVKMAKSGKPRPNHKTKLGIALCHRLCYNPKFKSLIKKIRPDWLMTKRIKQIKIINQKKQKILNLVKSGKPRPSQKTELGSFLQNCTNKRSWGYDSIFIDKIKKIDSTWLERSSFLNRQKLITMAKNGEKRPSRRRTKLGRLLVNYTSKSCGSYNKSFDKLIRKLRPDWFRK